MSYRKASMLMALSLAFGCICCAGTSPDPATGIEGLIKVAPTRPGPIRAGSENPSWAPFANMAFVVQNEKGLVAEFTTDAQGHFRISLAPGHYAVARKEQGGPGHCGPFDVDVVTGKMTSVEWGCDSGMR